MLKQVKTICGFCRALGLAQIDTTENVILMICVCPNCNENGLGEATVREAEAAEGLASLFG